MSTLVLEGQLSQTSNTSRRNIGNFVLSTPIAAVHTVNCTLAENQRMDLGAVSFVYIIVAQPVTLILESSQVTVSRMFVATAAFTNLSIVNGPAANEIRLVYG